MRVYKINILYQGNNSHKYDTSLKCRNYWLDRDHFGNESMKMIAGTLIIDAIFRR